MSYFISWQEHNRLAKIGQRTDNLEQEAHSWRLAIKPILGLGLEAKFFKAKNS